MLCFISVWTQKLVPWLLCFVLFVGWLVLWWLVGSGSLLLGRLFWCSQIVCWTGQFIGHGVFEKRAPALLDNLVQAFIMAPFFVLLEALQTSFGYEPYPGFHASVQAKIDADMKEWREKNLKLLS
nr:LOW QUALITY PROTEIN: 2-hydroxy-palmitic acid dioxygenase MPO1-like [Populus alba]